jgi:hypothetical protein
VNDLYTARVWGTEKEIIFMLGEQRKEFLRLLGRGVAASVARRCFTPGRSRYSFLRRWGWKAELIDIIPRSNNLLVNFYIYLPAKDLQDIPNGYVELAIRGIGHILGLGQAGVPYPSVFLRPSDAVDKVISQIDKGVLWLDGSDTPGSCLNRLALSSVDKDGSGPRVGSVAYRHCERYLTELTSSLPLPACTVGQFATGTSKDFCWLFRT